ncbi:MAG: DUF4405 domain-containing protein [Ruminococcus sp.]|nr:DUF4405 domain-containing protein [Ruminococcus sp.]
MKKITMILDTVMVILLPLLMGYSLVGELYHEITGVSMAALFTVHIILNRRWFTALFKGRYNAGRIVTTVINFLLIICVLTSMISGICLSKYLFRFLGISGLSAIMRTLHMLAAYWGLLIMSFHAGSHGGVMLSKLRSRTARTIVSCAFVFVSAYGVYAFIKRGFIDYLFGKVTFMFFNFSEPFIFYYLDYLSVIILFMTLGYLTIKICRQNNKPSR